MGGSIDSLRHRQRTGTAPGAPRRLFFFFLCRFFYFLFNTMWDETKRSAVPDDRRLLVSAHHHHPHCSRPLFFFRLLFCSLLASHHPDVPTNAYSYNTVLTYCIWPVWTPLFNCVCVLCGSRDQSQPLNKNQTWIRLSIIYEHLFSWDRISTLLDLIPGGHECCVFKEIHV